MKEGNLLYAGDSERNYRDLESIVSNSLWNLYRAVDLGGALELAGRTELQVIVAEDQIGDSGWSDLLKGLEALGTAPNLIICSDRTNEGSWKDILACGGFHLLATPFDELEVLRALDVAQWDWQRRNSVDFAVAAG
jgi:hypothetical protein